MRRTRRVFGRLRTLCPATGKEILIELTRTGLHVRPIHARKGKVVPLPDLVTMASGQGVLSL
jgi:hypothetical protein